MQSLSGAPVVRPRTPCYPPARTRLFVGSNLLRSSMKLSRLAPLACTTLPLLLALSLPADDLSFHPAANSEVAKTLKIDLEVNIKEASLTLDGNPMPVEQLDSITDKSLIVNMVIGVTDKFVETKDGKPIDLLRTFDNLKLTHEFGEDSGDVDEFKQPE